PSPHYARVPFGLLKGRFVASARFVQLEAQQRQQQHQQQRGAGVQLLLLIWLIRRKFAKLLRVTHKFYLSLNNTSESAIQSIFLSHTQIFKERF
ncbi:hypothetical protein, partial [Pseudomonas auratipiscis]|uniref:hypothetical protein n=1 Tax=Pseudomonas auratipiscis TaxID=3115853 RepID=UPI002E7C31AE